MNCIRYWHIDSNWVNCWLPKCFHYITLKKKNHIANVFHLPFVVLYLRYAWGQGFFPNDVWFEMLSGLIEFILIQILGRFNKYLCVFKTSDLLIYCIALGHSRITFLVLVAIGFMHITLHNQKTMVFDVCICCAMCVCVQCAYCQSESSAKCTERRIGSNRRAKGGTSFCCLYGNIFIDNIQLVVHICRVVRLMFYHSSTLSSPGWDYGFRVWIILIKM